MKRGSETRIALSIAWRYFKTGTRRIDLIAVLSLVGIILGVASLVVSMSVVSGYETTLRNVIADTVGHLTVLKSNSKDSQKLKVKDITPFVDNVIATTPFSVAEGLLAHKKKVLGVYLEGIDTKTVNDVLNIDQRVIRGSFSVSKSEGEHPKAVVGRVLAKNFDLEIGDVFRVVIPLSKVGGTVLRPKVQSFELAGVVSLGKHDYDERLILADRGVIRKFAGKSSLGGYRFRIADPMLADTIAERINREFPGDVNARGWKAMNRNLFEAIQFEKPAIFFVILIIVLAASFNVASTLYINILNKYSDIGILKAIGANRRMIAKVFVFQGLFVGAMGCLIGILVGAGLSRFFVSLQQWVSFIPEEVYKLTFIGVEIRAFDLLSIFLVSMLLCFFATLSPALRGARLKPVEGLRHD